MRPYSEMGEDELAAALRSLRSEPSPAFAAELDQRAAAGFPRRSPKGEWTPFADFLAWFHRGSRWRLLLPAGGVAIAAVAIATVVLSGRSSVISDAGGTSATSGSISGLEAGGGSESGNGGLGEGRPLTQPGTSSSAEAEESSSAEAAPKSTYEVEAPAVGNASGGPSNSAAGAEGAAANTAHRDVERGADIVIGTKPGEVGEASSKVFEAVHAYDGIVLNSSTRDGSGTHAAATFELLIPSGKVGDAMAAFSRIGEVLNRHETTTDITAPTVGTSERLQDSEARIEGLLAQLSEATTESEREVVEAELDSERRHAAHLKSKLSNLHRRADLSRVTVRIESGRGALSPGGSGGDDSWGIGSALDDAGHLLSVAAGVTIVGLAVLAPLMLLAFLAWLAGRAWTRHARDRALT